MMNGFRMLLEATADEAAQAQQQSSLVMLGVTLAFFAIMYFILIFPQRKKEKALKQQLTELAVGDKVITIGGLIGFVANIKENEVTISTSVANTLVTFQKAAISTIIKREDLNKTSEDK